MSSNPNDRRWFERTPTLNAGDLDRRVTIQQKTVVRDPNYGSEIVSWVTFAERWAKVRDVNAVERDGDGLRTITRTTLVTVRWLDGLTTDMRVVLQDGRILNVVSLVEIGRKVGQQLVCEEYSA